MTKLKVHYSNFDYENTVVEKIEFNILPTTTLSLEESDEGLQIKMFDTDTEDNFISGVLDKEAVKNLIRSLSIFKNQMNGVGDESNA